MTNSNLNLKKRRKKMLDFIIVNIEGIFSVITSVIAAAAAIAALTPTPKDDAVLSAIRKVIDALALNIGNAKNKA